MKLFEKEYACGYCFDTGYIVGVNDKFKTDERTGLKKIPCPRGCSTTQNESTNITS